MRVNTLATLGASAVFGLMAVFLARGWIHGAVESEFSKTQSEAPRLDLTPVIVADTALNFGDELSPQALRVVDYPKDALPENAFQSLEDIFQQHNGRILVLTRMAPNEPVLDFKISGPNGRGGLSALIAEGMRAVSVEVEAFNGVSGFILPGDHVDVVFTRNLDPEKRQQKIAADILLQNLRVLGVDQNMDPQNQTPSLAKTITLEVTHADAQKLNIAMVTGEISLILRRMGEVSAAPVGPIAFTDLETKRSRTAAKKPNTRPRIPKGSDSAEITVIRGDSRDQVSVLKEKASQQSDSTAGYGWDGSRSAELAGG